MSAKHTPGPWKVVDNRSLNGAYWICAPDDFTSHAEVRAGSAEAEEIGDELANANLIAAAPDLYAALEALAGGEDRGTWGDAVRPLIARFQTAAKFNADAVHNSDGADALAKLMAAMAEKLDRAAVTARAALARARGEP